MDGIVLIHKEEGYTSQDVCQIVKKKLGVKKVGHCGTLDPFATGLLILGINQGTKILPYLEFEKKTYIATLKLGSQTSTLDKTGEIVNTQPILPFTQEQIEEVFHSFLGKQKQIPPMYSAIKVNGKKLYELARQNVQIERKAREIQIDKLQLIDFKKDWIQFKVVCSKGTYVRVLGEEIAKKINMLGHLTALTRTNIGHFDLSQAQFLNQLQLVHFLPIYQAVPFFCAQPSKELFLQIKDGKPINYESDENFILWVDEKKNALAIYKKEKTHYYTCARGFYYENHLH